MATTAELYAQLLQDGVALRLDEGRLRARAPKGVLTERLQHDIRAHHAGLLALLQEDLSLSPVAPVPPSTHAPRAIKPAEFRVAIRTVMGSGLRVKRAGETYRVEDPQHALAPSIAQALSAHAQSQDILGECYVLGPILPPCGICGELRAWLDRDADTWRCWACVPPRLQTALPLERRV